jgi:uroporphyrinogen-III synthase
MRVLVTRPHPDASHTADELVRRGHRALVEPLLTIEILAAVPPPPDLFSAVAITSANAARIAGASIQFDSLRTLPLFAVGGHTAAAGREAGFHTVHDAAGDAASLAALIGRTVQPGSRVLHLAGADRARDLGALLAPARVTVEVLALYRMRPAETLGQAASALTAGEVDAVLHFSSRSAATFVTLAERQGLSEAARKLRHFCISQTVARQLAPIGAEVAVARQPREESLLELLDS